MMKQLNVMNLKPNKSNLYWKLKNFILKLIVIKLN